MEAHEDQYFIPKDFGRTLSEKWTEENGERFHPGLAAPSGLNDQRAVFVPRKSPEHDVVQNHTDHFNKALEYYKSSIKEKRLRDLDLRTVHSWDDVTREFEQAQKKYEEKTKGPLGFSRKFARAVGDRAESIYPFMAFIPDSHYTSSIKAALFLIFGAASRMSERRKQILEAFGKVPFLIQDAESSFEDFAMDELLKDSIIGLYSAILETVGVMMEWLVDKGSWEYIKALLQGPGYRKDLPTMIRTLQERSKAIQDRVSRLTRGETCKTASTVQKMEGQMESLSNTTEKIEFDIGETKRSVKITEAVTIESRSDIMQIKSEFVQKNKKDEEAYKRQDTAFGNLTDMMQNQVKTAQWNENVEKRKREDMERRWREAERAKSEFETLYKLSEVRLQHAQEQYGMLVRSDQLLELLKFDLADSSEDLEVTVRQGNISDYPTQGRSQLLMQNSKFQAWFASTQSKCLLVDGHAEFNMEKTSAMSIVCALIARNLPSATARPMAFFCGLHVDEFSATGPSDLIRSLLAQLISQYSLNTMFVDGRSYEELERFDLRRLCTLMTELVKKVPYGAVLFCLVDGISWYETEEMTQDACLVMQTLIDLTHDTGVRAVFKLLITSPTASRCVRKCVPPQDQLSLSSDTAEHDGSPSNRWPLMMQPGAQAEEMFDDSWCEEFDEGYDEA